MENQNPTPDRVSLPSVQKIVTFLTTKDMKYVRKSPMRCKAGDRDECLAIAVFRMYEFNSGRNTNLGVLMTANDLLKDWARAQGKAFLPEDYDELDKRVDRALAWLKINPYRGAMEWYAAIHGR